MDSKCDCLATLCKFQPQIESSIESLLCNLSLARRHIITQLSCTSCCTRFGALHCTINAFNVAERILSCLHDIQMQLHTNLSASVSIRIGDYSAPEGGWSSRSGVIVQHLITVELDELERVLNTTADTSQELDGQEVIEAKRRITGLLRRAKEKVTS
jgi:hypothetical protein